MGQKPLSWSPLARDVVPNLVNLFHRCWWSDRPTDVVGDVNRSGVLGSRSGVLGMQQSEVHKAKQKKKQKKQKNRASAAHGLIKRRAQSYAL